MTELTLISAVFITESLETSLADKRPVLGVSYQVPLQVGGGEELLVTAGLTTHMAGSVHSQVRLSVESVGQTFPADLALEAPRVRMPSRPVVTEAGPGLETSRAVLAPELSFSVHDVDVGMETGAAQDLLVASSHWTEKPALRGVEMF